MAKTIPVVLSACLAVVLVYWGCASTKEQPAARHVESQSVPRAKAAASLHAHKENAYLAYYTYDPDSHQETVEVFTPARWRRISDGGRADYLTKMYFANTRQFSNRQLRHQACFLGSAEEVVSTFFTMGDRGLSFDDLKLQRLSFSTDELMVGIQFTDGNTDRHFRITACRASGKGELFNYEKLLAQVEQIERSQPGARDPGSVTPHLALERSAAAVANADGFKENDAVQKNSQNLPDFELRADYENAFPADMPWREAELDISKPNDAQKLALILQQYAYEEMANRNDSPDQNFIPKRNTKRFWCHMPWLNQGANGREGVHGLTQERNLQPSKDIWPDAPLGGDWGVAFFNSVGCAAIQAVFGSKTHPLKQPRWEFANFKDGAVVYKILFTTAVDFKPIKNAFTWQANVNLPHETDRTIRPMKHIQMDIGIKDRQLKGLLSDASGPLANGWAMLTYYYDESYESPLPASLNLPEGLRHMRPMGIQTGFDEAGTMLFPGSRTNQVRNMLNGPADNPKSSCMGCHATAGTMQPMAPGVTTTKEWRDHVESGLAMDFGQQFALAKRNYETGPQ
jgi:hypothetical protein